MLDRARVWVIRANFRTPSSLGNTQRSRSWPVRGVSAPISSRSFKRAIPLDHRGSDSSDLQRSLKVPSNQSVSTNHSRTLVRIYGSLCKSVLSHRRTLYVRGTIQKESKIEKYSRKKIPRRFDKRRKIDRYRTVSENLEGFRHRSSRQDRPGGLADYL